MSKPEKLQRNSPMPLKEPKKKGTGDEGTEALKKGSTIIGQPELKEKNNYDRHKGNQFNEKKKNDEPYTD